MMKVFLVTADKTNGDVNKFSVQETNFKKARALADYLMADSSLMNIELTEPLGILVESSHSIQLAQCDNIENCKAMLAAALSKKGKKAGVRRARITGVVKKTAVATPEDALLGDFLAERLEDRLLPPSIKFDINRWMDSKEWT